MKLPDFLRRDGAEKVAIKTAPESDEVAALQASVRGEVDSALEQKNPGRLAQMWNVLSDSSAKAALMVAAGAVLPGCPSTGNGYADAAIVTAGLVGTAAALFNFKFLKPSEWIILRNRWRGGRTSGYEKQGGVAVWFRPTHTPWAINPAQPDDVAIDGTEKTFPSTGQWSDKIEIAGVPLEITWSVDLRLTSPRQVMFALGSDWQRTQERIKDLTNKVLIEVFGRAPLPAALIQSPLPANATPDAIARHVMNALDTYNQEINNHHRIRQCNANWGMELEIKLGPISEDATIQQRRMQLQQAGIDVQIAQTRIAEADAQGQAASRKAAGDAQAVGMVLKAKVDAVQGADPVVAAVILAGDGGNASGVAQAAVTAGAIRGAAQQIAQTGLNINVRPNATGSGNPGSGTSGSTP